MWRTAGVRPGERVAVLGCGGVGMSAVLGAVAVARRSRGRGRRVRRRSSRPRSRSARPTRCAGRATPRRPRRRSSPPAAAASTTRSRRPGRPEAARCAFLSTRARGAAVLIGIPRADAELQLPALSIPRMERRVLGSIYGSAAAGARLPAAARALPPRAAAARPADHGPAAARGGRGGRRPAARRRGAEGGAGDDDERRWTGGSARRGPARSRTAATSTSSSRGAARRPRRPPPACSARRGRATRRSSSARRAAARSSARRRSWSTSRRSPTTGCGRITWGAAQLGIAQGVLDALADGTARRRRAADELVLLVALWVDPAAHDETAVRVANREAMRAALADALAPPPPTIARPRRAPRAGRERVLRRRLTAMRIAAVEVRRYARSARPAVPRRLGSGAARRGSRRRSSIVRADDGRAGYASGGDGLPDAALLARPAGRPRPAPDRGRARAVRDRRLPRRAAVDRRGRGLGPRGARARRAALAAARRALGAAARVRLERRAGRAGGARARACVALRDAGVRAVKLRFHHADWRDDVEVVEAVRDAVGPRRRADGRREPGLAHAGRPLAALGRRDRGAVRARARAARRLLARGAAADRRRRRLRGAAPAHRRCASPPARWCAAPPRRATSRCAAAST